MLEIITIPCRVGHMDNLSYLLIDKDTAKSAIIDPSEVAPIVNKCKELDVKPDYILNTHHHYDHTDGNIELKQLYNAKVIGNIADKNRIPGIDETITPGETFALGNSIAEIIDVSAHTQGHILWYFAKDKALFTGDTLFNLCVGGLFEGNAEEMFAAMKKIRKLPDDVLFYPGHEYTMHSLSDARRFIGDTAEMREYIETAQKRLNMGLPVSPIPLGLEKKCNPYLSAISIENFSRLM